MKISIVPSIACVVSLSAMSLVSWANEQQEPNIIFILADDLGWTSTSVQMEPNIEGSRSDYYQTPNLERLAERGRRYSRAYSSAPICTPSRRSIHYGMTPARQHGELFASSFQPQEHMSLPQAIKQFNPDYRTALFGKWGSEMGAAPDEVGYDESDGPTDNWVGGMTFPHPENQFLYRVMDDPKRTFSVTDRAINFIERCAADETPFFLYVSYYAVHKDIECRMETLEKYKRKRGDIHFNEAFAAMVDDMDTAIGRILDTVDSLGLTNETYIIFTSDNGGESGYELGGDTRTIALDQVPTLNYPLKNGKGSLFEGGLRVPFIAAGPGIPENTFSSNPVVGWDLMPTMIELVGGDESMLTETIDGRSFKESMLGLEQAPREELPVFHSPLKRDRKMSVLHKGDYKLILCWDNGDTYLIKLPSDISEDQDLSAANPEMTEQLKADLMRYLAEVDATMPKERK